VRADSVDTITVGQAYHWFAGEPALVEFARVLRAGGHLALMWNARDAEQPLWREISRIIEPLRAETPRHGDGRWRESLAATELFLPVEAEGFTYRQTVDHAGLIDRVCSISFIAALAPHERAEVVDQLTRLVAGEPPQLELQYLTEVYVFERVGA